MSQSYNWEESKANGYIETGPHEGTSVAVPARFDALVLHWLTVPHSDMPYVVHMWDKKDPQGARRNHYALCKYVRHRIRTDDGKEMHIYRFHSMQRALKS